jgi:hypothetical protein
LEFAETADGRAVTGAARHRLRFAGAVRGEAVDQQLPASAVAYAGCPGVAVVGVGGDQVGEDELAQGLGVQVGFLFGPHHRPHQVGG